MRPNRLPVTVTFHPIPNEGKNSPFVIPFLPVNQFGIRQLFPLLPINLTEIPNSVPTGLVANPNPSLPAPDRLERSTAFGSQFPTAEAVPEPLPLNSVTISMLSTTPTVSNLVSTMPIRPVSASNPVNKISAPKLSPKALSPMQAIDPLDETPKSLWDRIVQAFLVTLTYAGLGLLIDGIINLVKALASPIATQTFWLFFPLLAGLGLLLGIVFGTRAIDAILIPFRTRDTPVFDEADVSYDMMRAVGIGLGIGIVGWLVLMILT